MFYSGSATNTIDTGGSDAQTGDAGTGGGPRKGKENRKAVRRRKEMEDGGRRRRPRYIYTRH